MSDVQMDLVANPGSGHRRARFMITVVVVSLTGLVLWAIHSHNEGTAIVTERPASGTMVEATPTAVSLRDLAGIPVPEGMTGVAASGGVVVGFVPTASLGIEAADRNGGVGQPLTIAGQQTDIRGIDVVDETGQRVGYLVDPIGFVDVATAQDLAQLRQNIAAHEALERKLISEDSDLQPGG